MPPSESARANVAYLWRRVASERRRAARAAAIAESYEAGRRCAPEPVRLLRARMAELHRQTETLHRATAGLYQLHAVRMTAWLHADDRPAFRPAFMAAVAATLGTRSASAMLRGPRRTHVLAASSDGVAREAHELEVLLGEGPAVDAAAKRACIRVAGTELQDRWPLYGPAVAELGVRSVVAAPLQVATACIGALCAYNREPVIRDGMVAATGRIADVLTHAMLRNAGLTESADGIPAMPLFDEADYQVVVHQAAGMVSVLCECGVDDAEDLIRARAFAEGQPVEQVALGVIRGETSLC